ncbi:hypothetical protein P152DRAFT_481206 [Eremomyces bilateralis CBS 781.70]|uniref:Transcription initiation factor IIF subunit beta n=1 Tax=Eremomyces bilateralis CBS 781.70 TaxID=1392243 RepID=A0A6G1G7K0_9PEZI|nr:uncharacterized protein P152DRAFT_481206 [Eremomyces bilateralis CBS 781.70]KAF1814047.1 hypothetical protein P152DRAFT_481206 [Eremomyces bilateralis CBS 781.70]
MATHSPAAYLANEKPLDGYVKTEDMDSQPVGGDPTGGYMDDDDEGDELNMTNVHEDALLMRVDHDLWVAIQDMTEDEPIQMGYVREWENGKTKMFLKEMPPNHYLVPREYDLNVTDANVKNLFVFAEKEMPAFKPNMLGRFKDQKKSIGSQEDSEKGAQRMRRGKRIIPKRTTLYAGIRKELSVLPVQNDTFHALEKAKFSELLKKEFRFTTKTSTNDTKMLGLDNMENLLKYGARPAKTQDNKAIRMDRSLLLERLGYLFGQYRYWTLRTLKNELQQPEAYLKEVLQGIAVLVKSGPFANHWTLRPEMVETIKWAERGAAAEGAAPGVGTESSAGEEEDEEAEMEDVL